MNGMQHEVYTLFKIRVLKWLFAFPYMEPFMVLKGTTKDC